MSQEKVKTKDVSASPIKVVLRLSILLLVRLLESINLCSDEVEPSRLEEAQGLRGLALL